MIFVGGHQPVAGYVFIPSVLITAPNGHYLESTLKRNKTVSIEIVPSKDSQAAEYWLVKLYRKDK